MHGNRDTPLGLILASIPIQALLVAGVAAGFASIHSQTAQYGQYGAGWEKPMPYCMAGGGWEFSDPQSPSAVTADPPAGDSVPAAQVPVGPMPGSPACLGYVHPGMFPPDGRAVIKVPCCGGFGNYYAP